MTIEQLTFSDLKVIIEYLKETLYYTNKDLYYKRVSIIDKEINRRLDSIFN